MANERSTDVLTPEQRSYCMSRIRGRNTKPEVKLRKTLWALGYRYRVRSNVTGAPDIVFPGKKIAVFVDGCFWHKCPWHFKLPKNNRSFWSEKLEKNAVRDMKVNRELAQQNWLVLRFWEHDVKNNFEWVISRIIDTIKS